MIDLVDFGEFAGHKRLTGILVDEEKIFIRKKLGDVFLRASKQIIKTDYGVALIY